MGEESTTTRPPSNLTFAVPLAPGQKKIGTGDDDEHEDGAKGVAKQYRIYQPPGLRNLSKQALTHCIALIDRQHGVPPFLLRVWSQFRSPHAQLLWAPCGP